MSKRATPFGATVGLAGTLVNAGVTELTEAASRALGGTGQRCLSAASWYQIVDEARLGKMAGDVVPLVAFDFERRLGGGRIRHYRYVRRSCPCRRRSTGSTAIRSTG